MNVIDVSHNNGTIDWRAIKEQGLAAIIRLGFGSKKNTPTLDKNFKVNMAGALENGVPVGVYLFSYAMSVQNAEEEAVFVARELEPYRGKLSYPVYYDMEGEQREPGVPYEYDQFKLGRATVTAMHSAFCRGLRAAGWTVGIYTNVNWYETRLDRYLFDVEGCELWLAHWGAAKPRYACGLWQTSDKGEVRGIKGKVDTNVAFKDYPALLMGGIAPPVPAPAPPVTAERPTLRLGSTGEAVERLQAALFVPGVFDAVTEGAVRSFQAANKLSVDGVVGPKTWSVLDGRRN